jgi:hypothetical protein
MSPRSCRFGALSTLRVENHYRPVSGIRNNWRSASALVKTNVAGSLLGMPAAGNSRTLNQMSGY